MVIPSTIDGYAITAIGNEAFRNSRDLTLIEIPDTVTIIGPQAFYNCSSLTSIDIPDAVTIIGIRAFFECSSLTSIAIPNLVTDIGEGIFYRCQKLTEIKFPDKITSIVESMFYGCTSLETITIPNTVTNIGTSAFSGCVGLTTIKIPETVTIIGPQAFYNCTALTSIDIPDSVETLGGHMFYNCGLLKSIKIPNSVTKIGAAMFYGCTSLETITIPNTLKSISWDAFKKCTSLETVVLPSTLTSLDSTAFDDSTVSKLIFICQNKDDMNILDDVKTNIPSNINVYRMAVSDIKNNQQQIDSYEFMDQSISLGDIFETDSIIYEGKTGDTACSDPTIKVEDYLDMFITYTLEGPMTEDTKIEDNTLYIGKNETEENLRIKAVYKTNDIQVPIHIVKAESISIKKKPIDTYDEGKPYKPEGLEIAILYENSHKEFIKYEDNKNDFSFKYNELSFGTKEQEITYGRFQVTHSLTIYGNKTLRESNVEVKGMFTEESILEIEDTEIDSDLKDKEIIVSYDINAANGSYKEILTISFDVGNEYNGKSLNIRHNGTEEFEELVSEGKVTIEVDHLSPFIIYTEKEIVEEPETPIIPKPEPDIPDDITPEIPDEPVIKPSEKPDIADDSKPVVKPIEPTPDKPIQTKPSQNQQYTVSTEDNNHLLLWSVLGIVGISVVIMSVKKKKS